MTGPAADRPVMPGYGVLPADQGSGLMPWSEAERRLTVSHDYWCATVAPGGRPQVNGTFVVRPERVIALTGADFPGSPTRWTFPPA